MLKKFLFIGIIIAAHNSFAETCPTISDIQTNYFNGWQTLNINTGEPVSTTTLENFKHNIHDFALAEWMQNAPEGAAHCYYQGLDKHNTNYLGVFLAKTNLRVDTASPNWQKITREIAQCRAGLQTCAFLTT
jgi:hypothetical protein